MLWTRVTAGLTLLLLAVSCLLPWRTNEFSHDQGLLPHLVVGRDPLYASLVVPAFGLAVTAAVLLMTRRLAQARPLAHVASVVMAVVVATVPLGWLVWDGVDAQGRPTGGMAYDVHGPGALAALGAVLLLSASVEAATLVQRTQRNRDNRSAASTITSGRLQNANRTNDSAPRGSA